MNLTTNIAAKILFFSVTLINNLHCVTSTIQHILNSETAERKKLVSEQCLEFEKIIQIAVREKQEIRELFQDQWLEDDDFFDEREDSFKYKVYSITIRLFASFLLLLSTKANSLEKDKINYALASQLVLELYFFNKGESIKVIYPYIACSLVGLVKMINLCQKNFSTETSFDELSSLIPC